MFTLFSPIPTMVDALNFDLGRVVLEEVLLWKVLDHGECAQSGV